MERNAPPAKETEWMIAGQKIHDWLCGSLKDEDLTEDQLRTARQCQELELKVLHKWMEQFVACQPVYSREERLWLREDPANPFSELIFSGKYDLMHSVNGHALIIDDKSGYSEVEGASANDQLYTLAILAHLEHGFTSVHAAVVQPKLGMRVEMTHYNEEALKQGVEILLDALKAARQPDAPLTPGEHCGYCRALAICPAAQAKMTGLSVLPVEERAGDVTGEAMVDLLDRCVVAEKVIKAIRDAAKRKCEAGQRLIKGNIEWLLEESPGKRKIEDQDAARKSMMEYFSLTPEEWASFSKVSIKDCTDMARMVRPEDKVGDLRLEVLRVLGDSVQRGESKSLERKILTLE
jgi:hypothetical protein